MLAFAQQNLFSRKKNKCLYLKADLNSAVLCLWTSVSSKPVVPSHSQQQMCQQRLGSSSLSSHNITPLSRLKITDHVKKQFSMIFTQIVSLSILILSLGSPQMPLCNIQAVPGVGEASEQGHSSPVPTGGPVRPGLSCMVSGRQR